MLGKTKTLTEPYAFIWSGDPAINVDTKDKKAVAALAEALRIYNSTGDASGIPLHPEVKPRVFKLRHLTGKAYARLRDIVNDALTRATGHHAAAYEAIQMSLEAIENETNEDGEPYVVEHMTANGIKLASPDVMGDIIRVGGGALARDMFERIVIEVLAPD